MEIGKVMSNYTLELDIPFIKPLILILFPVCSEYANAKDLLTLPFQIFTRQVNINLTFGRKSFNYTL